MAAQSPTLRTSVLKRGCVSLCNRDAMTWAMRILIVLQLILNFISPWWLGRRRSADTLAVYILAWVASSFNAMFELLWLQGAEDRRPRGRTFHQIGVVALWGTATGVTIGMRNRTGGGFAATQIALSSLLLIFVAIEEYFLKPRQAPYLPIESMDHHHDLSISADQMQEPPRISVDTDNTLSEDADNTSDDLYNAQTYSKDDDIRDDEESRRLLA